jgi:hypothetical protein
MMNHKIITKIQFTVTASAVLLLASCAATQTAIEHRNLETNTQLSQVIFLKPITKSQKTIYIEVKNTSDERLDLAKPLAISLAQHGYQVISNPHKAHYQLQVRILKIGKMSLAASQSILSSGFESALTGAGVGIAAGAFTHHTSGMLAGGLAGGVIGLAADSLIKDINYSMVTDVQISEKVGKGVKVTEQFQSNLKNGSATKTVQTSSNDSKYQDYRIRIVSNADKVNLKFADAKSALEKGLVKAISGIF